MNPLLDVERRHDKQKIAMRSWLEGRRFFRARDAMELVHTLEQGTRKDGVTPKFHHQLSVARVIFTLEPHLIFPEDALATAFLHDLLEDHGEEWSRDMLKERFGKRVSDAVWAMTKKSNGLIKSSELYYGELAECPIASVTKCADRAHNLQTMIGVFTPDKQTRYLEEVETYYYSMIKRARRSFPSQYPAYENLKILLRCQCRLIEAIHAARNLTAEPS